MSSATVQQQRHKIRLLCMSRSHDTFCVAGVCNLDPSDDFQCIDECGYYFWQRLDPSSKRCVMRLDVAAGVLVVVALAVLAETALAVADWRLLRSVPPRHPLPQPQ